MDCSRVREHLNELNRGLLEPHLAEAVRAHADGCAPCAEALRLDAELRAEIRAEAPRYPAPPALRGRVQALLAEAAPRRAGWRGWLLGHPRSVRGLVGALAVLLLAWAGSLWIARDPVSLLAASAIAEHVEYVEETLNSPAADPRAVVRELRGRIDYAFEPVFAGDSHVQLVAGRVSPLAGTRAAALIYRDQARRYTTLFLMPGADIVIPADGRMPIEAFKPYHRAVAGRELLLWSQGDLTCMLVSDLDQAGTAAMFLKIRKAT